MRVLIADDHRVLRAGLRLLIESQPDMVVVGEASSGPEALTLATELRPDIAVIDLSMPQGSGLDVLPQLSSVTRIIVLTVHDDAAYIRRVMAAGGHGYVLKEAADREFLDALRAVAAGNRYIHPTLAPRLFDGRSSVESTATSLSRREREVLRLIALGHSVKEMADKLDVGVRTIETYQSRVKDKLGLYSRSQLVRFALAQGIISAPAARP